ncbi:FAD-dependent oxidoreductase [Pseudoalteromonas sp. BDTF-M6]|uniref:FAD-dependent oxidoreductase n=1 Tax=Pseudoalteromonas sp. BDTF-M6 TaxID=2796132 RepID=UPI001BAF4DBE|nr:FAD-dependent oxidoreductase [Pseudoalteromonas sp. BDTF-M6]MBS3798919.1 FAD-dependent monooxygenase [Pseudoalteromonas sp. BDTF-M6]
MSVKQVLIVGGGMVGAACAIKLAKQGMQVCVIEQQVIDPQAILQSEQVDIRVSAINRFSEQLLDELGAMPALRQNRIAPYTQLEAYEDKPEQLLFDCQELGASHLGHLVENKLIQAALWAQFDQYDIKVCSPEGQAQQLLQTPQGATLVYEHEQFVCDLIIAADGGRSRIRQLAGIGVTGWQYQQQCMGILIKLDAPQQTKTWQQFKPSGPIAFLPMQYPYANLIWYDEGIKLKAMQQLDKDALKAKVIEHFFALPGEFELVSSAVFPLARQHANTYVGQRLALIGDAAHTINPLAGQGVNLGFKDVVALAQAFEETDTLEAALKRYQGQRRGENLLMMTMMDACYFGFSNSVTPLKRLRNLALSAANKAGPLKRQVLKHAMGGIT